MIFFHRNVGASACVIVLLLCGATAAVAQAGPDPAASKNTVKLTNVVSALPAGTPYMKATKAIFCITPIQVLTASGSRETQELPPYTAAFRTELEQAGFKVIAAEDNLFGQQDAGAADYQVAAAVTDMRIDACVYAESALGFTIGDTFGTGSMKIDWQVYAPLKKQVVARITTSGAIKLEKSVQGGYQRLITGAFAANAHQLAANPEFRAAITADTPKADQVLTPAKEGPIALSGSLKAGPRPLSDAAGSVVTLLTGSGTGSGVLVSDDGYVMTNAHVVGDEKQIRVRWSDGIETVADVIRSSKVRDIALVKTNPRERSPLAIKRGAVTPGQKVLAIGSPRGKEFQGTVSSGVVSATRVFDGLRYIQIDVSVSFGSSGGALLDESGSLIGFTDLGITNAGMPAGLNLSIPISDALDFLSLEQH